MIRKLSSTETELIATIDRTEDITFSYRYEHGQLNKVHQAISVTEWDCTELKDIIERSKHLIKNGGALFGYFDNDIITGVASINATLLSAPDHYLLMDILYISHQQRGKGIGVKLFDAIKNEALGLGAQGLYISATPTINTVDFYLRLSLIHI